MISKTAEYALRAVTCLAEHAACDKTPSSADDLAETTQVPRRYLNRVLQDLVADGLVDSQRGPRGGYKLAKSTEAITILDVVNAVAPLGRIENCPLGLKSHKTLCPLHAELDRAYEATEKAFAGVTIAELLDSTNPSVPLFESP
ncbi:MAG: Rrf2 family transcriptional regulator [bacterium]|nr:Rrf2 family transcriptional regulator [bacterium]